MKQEVNIQPLVKLASAGDADAFGKIYDIFLDEVYRFVYFRVGNRQDAEDITEQIFISMFTAISRYNDDGLPFGAWVYRIARNKVTDFYRSRKPLLPLVEAVGVTDPKPGPEEQTDQKMLRNEVLRSLTQIPHQYQELIILKFIEDKDNEEISVILDKPVSHIRVLQHRAIAALRKVFNYE